MSRIKEKLMDLMLKNQEEGAFPSLSTQDYAPCPTHDDPMVYFDPST